jgi:hypothetical protein
MINTNSYIMRDQVVDVVKSFMNEDKGNSFYRLIRQISIITCTLITFAL